MKSYGDYSSGKGASWSTSKIKSFLAGMLSRRWARVLLVGLSWAIGYTCLADDSIDSDAKVSEESSTEKSEESAKSETAAATGLKEKQSRFMSLLTQMVALSQADPNSPEVKALLKEVEGASADLESHIETQKKVDLTTLPEAGEKAEVLPATATPEKLSVTPDPQTVIEQIQKVMPAAEKPLEAPIAEEPAQTEDTNESSVEKALAVSEDDIVQLKMKDNILDLNYLIDYVGKVMKFNFLFDSDKGIVGKIKMQKYGEIRRRDLLPLLESLLSFNGYTMIREDPFIRIVKRDVAHKTAQPLIVLDDQVPELEVGDSVVARIVVVKHISAVDAKNFLKNFADDQTMVPVPKTNTLIITEYAHRMERLMEMLTLVDQPGPDVKLETLPLQHTEAGAVSKQISELLKNLNQQTSAAPAKARAKPAAKKRPTTRVKKEGKASAASSGSIQTGKDGPVLIVDDRTNRIFVIGDEEGIAQVKDLLSLLDVPDGPPIRLVPIEVKHVLADEVGQLIVDLIRDINKDPGSGDRPAASAAKPVTTSSKSSEEANSPISPSRLFPLISSATSSSTVARCS